MLMIDKGYFTKDEYFTKLKEVQTEYKTKDNALENYIRWSNRC